MDVLLFSIVGYLSGSLPFSVWLPKLILGADVRKVGEDDNPGAANAFKAAGKSRWWLGLTALLLDGFKGLIPVAVARYNFGIDGWALVPVALAPIAGHAYSVFLRFRGGKAIVVTFGVWTALTVYVNEPVQGGYLSPLILGGFFIFFMVLLSSSAWSVILGMLGLLGYLLISHAEAWLLAVWIGNFLILVLKHWSDLQQWPSLRKKS